MKLMIIEIDALMAGAIPRARSDDSESEGMGPETDS